MNIQSRSFPDYNSKEINSHRSNTKIFPDANANKITEDYKTELEAECLTLDSPIIRKLSELKDEPIFSQEINEKKWHKLKIRDGEWGLYSLDQFKERFHILTQGIFEDIIFDKLVFNGSLIGACLYKNKYEKKFGICHDKSFKEQKDALLKYFEHYFPSKASREDKKISLLSEQELSDIDIIVEAQDNKNFDRIVMRLFYDLKLEGKQLFKITNKKSYKYFIRAPELLRPIELFRIFHTEPIDAIRKFHFPYVRNMFDGEDVYMLPSCVIFGRTGMIHEYQYLSTTEPRGNYIVKYYNRGCNFNLSDSEHRYLNGFLKRRPQALSIE